MSQPGSAPQAASQYSPDMIRPERIANIPMLSAELKVTYTEGLTKLWTALEASPHGSETHNKATAKIKEVSRKIMRHITNWKANNQQQQQRSQAQVPQQQLSNQQQNQQAPRQPQQQQAQPAPQQQPAQQQISNQQPQQYPQQQQQQAQYPPQQQPIARPPNQQQPYQSPAAQGQPQPLSHAAVINQAQRTYSERQGQGTPTSQSAGQPFNHSRIAAFNAGNPKFPIPKNVPNSGPHNAVPLGPARPTFGGPSNGAPGVMGQPAVQETPHFILEGEGEHVLSKKKLDELVRQATGGGEGDGLTPDVEESVLPLTDDFVDSIITAACSLAKIRPNSTLDIRDIQIMLERNYNIRVPGYSLDRIRTVRKFQPAPGWTQRMNAVQVAKVMGKNDA